MKRKVSALILATIIFAASAANSQTCEELVNLSSAAAHLIIKEIDDEEVVSISTSE